MVVSAVRDYDFPSGYKHNVIGNTWKVNEDGSWYLPDKTLGWEFIEFASRYYLNQLDEPFVLTDEQLRIALWLYALNDDGRFIADEYILQRLKGWGKDPFSMAVAGFEAFGNCRFSHWSESGEPVGMRHPQPSVIVAAVSETQAKVTLKQARWLFSRDMITDFGIDMGQLSITGLRGRAEIVVLSASFRSAEGRPTSFAILNETHHWVTGNNGTELYDTIDGNISKGANGWSRRLHVTNAYLPGEDSVAERTREAYLGQEEYTEAHGIPYSAGLFYDSLEADYRADLSRDTALLILPEIRGDSVWLSEDSFLRSIMKKSITVQRSRRMYYNQITTAADSLFDVSDLESCVDDLPLRPGEMVTLGFDGSRTRDASALVAVRVADRKAFLLGVWERPPNEEDSDWWLDSDVVDSAVHEAFRRYRVLAFYSDVNLWESEINNWSDEYRERLAVRASSKHSIGYDMRKNQRRITEVNEMLVASVQNHSFKFDGSPVTKRHMLNVRRRTNSYGVSFGKESRESPKKIDVYAATLLAFMAALDVAEGGKVPEPKKSRRLLRRR